MNRIEVLSGPERRRRWSTEQKRSIGAEAFAPGAKRTRFRPNDRLLAFLEAL